jgi:hypothetical protein
MKILRSFIAMSIILNIVIYPSLGFAEDWYESSESITPLTNPVPRSANLNKDCVGAGSNTVQLSAALINGTLLNPGDLVDAGRNSGLAVSQTALRENTHIAIPGQMALMRVVIPGGYKSIGDYLRHQRGTGK